MFNPTEIIFATTQACNLHCRHCFVSRSPLKLNIDDAKKLIDSCTDTEICKIGFSGGEPFLYLEFLLEIIKYAYDRDFMFDQIMTNGDWWKTEEELKEVLQKLYDTGYDGKIGLSYDSFHGQNFERIKTFCAAVTEIFGEENINIQAVVDETLSEEESNQLKKELNQLSEEFYADIFIMPQTFQAKDERAWKSRKWFKEDYCEGPGQILFVHATGDIAPCCGFANENPALFIGKITDSLETIMEKAQKNSLVNQCYNEGLLKKAKELEKQGCLKKRTADICTFCDYLATDGQTEEKF
ncbi:MAG: 4Fe-4S cluster-binding domain-containing protein [Treponema sp.]|nr:4Fe-4S cluster-binding domain-containing protein [Candidatus Treponema equifaecale]